MQHRLKQTLRNLESFRDNHKGSGISSSEYAKEVMSSLLLYYRRTQLDLSLTNGIAKFKVWRRKYRFWKTTLCKWRPNRTARTTLKAITCLLTQSHRTNGPILKMSTKSIAPRSSWMVRFGMYVRNACNLDLSLIRSQIIMQYYYSSRARRGYEYHMAARLVPVFLLKSTVS